MILTKFDISFIQLQFFKIIATKAVKKTYSGLDCLKLYKNKNRK